jgi:hypothetical protein
MADEESRHALIQVLVLALIEIMIDFDALKEEPKEMMTH